MFSARLTEDIKNKIENLELKNHLSENLNGSAQQQNTRDRGQHK